MQNVRFVFSTNYISFVRLQVCPNVIFLALSVAYGLPLSESSCIVGGFLTLLVGCAAMPFIEWEWALLVVAFVMGLATAMTQGTLFSICGVCGPRHTAALTVGTGMAGTVICFIRMATKSAPSKRLSVDVFFGFSAAFCVICVLMYRVVVKESRFYSAQRSLAKGSDSTIESEDRSEALEAPLVERVADDDEDDEKTPQAELPTLEMIRKLRIAILSVVLVFLVTLAIFPGIVSEMESNRISSDWWSLILFTIFNATDTIGKSLPAYYQPLDLRGLLLGACVRLAFIPLCIICVTPNVISWDVAQGLLIAVFGLSNGFLGTVAMMLGPEEFNDASKNKAGLIMVFFLTSGLAVGSWVGVGLKQLMDHTSL